MQFSTILSVSLVVIGLCGQGIMASPAANAEADAYAEPTNVAEASPDVEAPDTPDQPPFEVRGQGCYGPRHTNDRQCDRYVSPSPPCSYQQHQDD